MMSPEPSPPQATLAVQPTPYKKPDNFAAISINPTNPTQKIQHLNTIFEKWYHLTVSHFTSLYYVPLWNSHRLDNYR